MGWKKSDKTDEFVDEPNDEILNGSALSQWHDPKGRSLVSDLLTSPFIWVTMAAIVLVTLIIVFLPDSGQDRALAQIEDLSKKMEMLENRMFMLETSVENLSRSGSQKSPSGQDQNPDKLVNRMNRVEANVNQRLEQITLEVATLRQAVTETARTLARQPEPKPAAAVEKEKPAPKKMPAKKAPAKKAETKYHTVQKGDTLYSLSRTYGISVETIREINKMSKADKLLIGQKLQVSK